MKLAKIGLWYIGFIVLILASDVLGTRSALAKRIAFVQVEGKQIRHPIPREGIYLFGDCTAVREPSALPRYAQTNASLQNLQKHIADIPSGYAANDIRVSIVLLAGIKESVPGKDSDQSISIQLATLSDSINARFPNATVYVIHPREVRALAQIPSYRYKADDAAHINPAGYAALWTAHPEIPIARSHQR